MSGLVKPKEYDWKDSNMALFGSDTEKKVKKESAESEGAWQGSGEKPGVEVWRINKFKVERVPEEDVGTFYNGDSYIILNTYQEEDSDELLYDVHFWIGKYSTQDEYGTAAYKTVELDTFHDDKPVQHREVSKHESSLFKSYFPTFTLLKGGHDTGFRRVLPENPPRRLLKIKGTTVKNCRTTEIPLKQGNMNDEDCFILDTGDILYTYYGKDCDKDEKFVCQQEVNKLKSDRCGKSKIEICSSLNHPAIKALKEGTSKVKEPAAKNPVQIMKVFTDEDNSSIKMEVVSESLDRDALTEDDVFICSNGDEVFVFVGKDASVDERKNGLPYANKYLMDQPNPIVPITVVGSGQKSKAFEAIW